MNSSVRIEFDTLVEQCRRNAHSREASRDRHLEKMRRPLRQLQNLYLRKYSSPWTRWNDVSATVQ